MIGMTGTCSHCGANSTYTNIHGVYEWECSECFCDTVSDVTVCDVVHIPHECDVCDTVQILVTPEVFLI